MSLLEEQNCKKRADQELEHIRKQVLLGQGKRRQQAENDLPTPATKKLKQVSCVMCMS
jgi:hypothetical protein